MEAYLGDIWFILWGLLWGIYFALDGYDFGIGMLLPVIGMGTEKERATVYQVTGPFWDGNEVWLITAGGVTFAAFPLAYAVLFSSLYTPLMLLLLALIMRGVAAEFRHQWSNRHWNLFWDLVMAGTGFLAALLLGVAFSNIFRGLPLNAQHLFQGNILNLLHPYALLGGVLFVLMFVLHGAAYLSWRVVGDLSQKAALTAKLVWPVFFLSFLLYVVLTFFWAGLYVNYFKAPLLLVLPVACLASFLMSGHALYRKKDCGSTCLYLGLGIITLALTGVMGIYPNLLPSRLDPAGAVTIANGASSPKTLLIMLVVALIFVPIVIAYQWWTHKTLAEKINSEY
ncbi:MAG: cytochrome d ubiquinol oxidase subunit II [Candidatus Adiutrix sp.]|jgi:cytochrome d ubiquinol oxidase subunit II|nr:cytochrome d ubiquinol oxidase subunit II [Candidatus Adiutrix sp.]